MDSSANNNKSGQRKPSGKIVKRKNGAIPGNTSHHVGKHSNNRAPVGMVLDTRLKGYKIPKKGTQASEDQDWKTKDSGSHYKVKIDLQRINLSQLNIPNTKPQISPLSSVYSASSFAGHRVIIHNIPDNVTRDEIQELFGEDIGELLEWRLLRPGAAEVIYRRLEDAEKAILLYNNRLLDDRVMKVQLAPNAWDCNEVNIKQSTRGYKVIVNNMPYSIKTKDEVKELFEVVGDLLASRLVLPGKGEVVFRNLKDAQDAVQIFNSRRVDGRLLKCCLLGGCSYFDLVKM